MGGMQFDREIFATPKEPLPRSSSPAGPLLLLAVVALVALGVFAFYEFAKRGEGFGAGRSSDITAIVEKLDEIEGRMNAGAIIDQGAPRKRRFLAVQN